MKQRINLLAIFDIAIKLITHATLYSTEHLQQLKSYGSCKLLIKSISYNF